MTINVTTNPNPEGDRDGAFEGASRIKARRQERARQTGMAGGMTSQWTGPATTMNLRYGTGLGGPKTRKT